MPENISTQSAEIDLLLREKMTDFNFVTLISLSRLSKSKPRSSTGNRVTKMAHDRWTDEPEYFLKYCLDVLPPWTNYMLMDLKSVPLTFRSEQFTITGCKAIRKSWQFRIGGTASVYGFFFFGRTPNRAWCMSKCMINMLPNAASWSLSPPAAFAPAVVPLTAE